MSTEMNQLYKCHLCFYTSASKIHFETHMNSHFDHKCPFCDYSSKTDGRLKRHIRDFHSENPPDSWAGTRVLKSNNNGEESNSPDPSSANGNSSGGKPRKYKCKQCEFIATNKQEFWDHSKAHIKSEKLLTCPNCNFVTEYKHHLEYHLRNHFGSKPFKCAKCNYSCVNKSMLNSHMKSHSNIYQYRCSDCNYATKYCHSLKLHLRKYSHTPAVVLNLDGTPNPYPVIDIYGTRRGPRPKKSKNQNNENQQQMDSNTNQSTPSITSPNSIIPNQMSPMVSSPSQLSSQLSVPPLIPTSLPLGLPLFGFPPNPALMHGELGSFLGHHSMIPSQISSQINPFTQSIFQDSHSIPRSSPSSIDSTKTSGLQNSPQSSDHNNQGQSIPTVSNFLNSINANHFKNESDGKKDYKLSMNRMNNNSNHSHDESDEEEEEYDLSMPKMNNSSINNHFQHNDSEEDDDDEYDLSISRRRSSSINNSNHYQRNESDDGDYDSNMPKSPVSPITAAKLLPNSSVGLLPQLNCNFCSFSTTSREVLGRHLLFHAAALNHDICKVYGINANNPAEVAVVQKVLIEEMELRRSPSPLDLSNNKSLVTNNSHEQDFKNSQESTAKQHQDQQEQQQQQSRAQKRKGKACKLNVFDFNGI